MRLEIDVSPSIRERQAFEQWGESGRERGVDRIEARWVGAYSDRLPPLPPKLIAFPDGELPGDWVQYSGRSHLVELFETRYKLFKQEVFIVHGVVIWPDHSHRFLERNVFIRNRRTARRGVLRLRRALVEVVSARRCRDSARTAGMLAAAFTARTKQHKIVCDDLGHVLFLAGRLIVPGAGLQAAFDVDLAALLQILAGNLRQPLPQHHIVPFGAVLPLAVFALETLVGGQGDLRDRRALRRELHFGILAKVSNQDDFIYAFHGCRLLH